MSSVATSRQKMRLFGKGDPKPAGSLFQQFIEQTKDQLFAKPWLVAPAKPAVSCMAVLVEPRVLPETEYVIRNINYFTEGWPILWFHGRKNAAQAGELAGRLQGNLKLVALEVDDLKNNYNELLTSPMFWRKIPAENILVFQTDALLLRRGIQDFLGYDYIGAPWHFGGAGNGGLSFRKRSKMLEVLRRVNYKPALGNEDVFFVAQLKQIPETKLPTVAQAGEFSIETVFFPEPLGLHNAWHYLPAAQIQQLLKPEMYD